MEWSGARWDRVGKREDGKGIEWNGLMYFGEAELRHLRRGGDFSSKKSG